MTSATSSPIHNGGSNTRRQNRRCGRRNLVVTMALLIAVIQLLFMFLVVFNGGLDSTKHENGRLPAPPSAGGEKENVSVDSGNEDGADEVEETRKNGNPVRVALADKSQVDEKPKLNSEPKQESEPKPPSKGTEGNVYGSRPHVHTCTCLEGKETNTGTAPSHPGLRWLHIPKTGTSFISTLWTYACNRKGNIDLKISPVLNFEACESCYDHALTNRYPLEMYCRTDAIASMETQHKPVTISEMYDLTATPPVPSHHSRSQEVVVGFFREPSARIASAFDDGMHASGMRKAYDDMYKQCQNNVTCFANYPGIKGCMGRMLTGAHCAVPPTEAQKYGTFALDSSIKALKTMGFVGIMEEWNESICQFHKTFGGVPSQSQFSNVHAGKKKTSVKDLGDGYHDPVDDAVYAAAVKEFHRRKGTETCYQYAPVPTGVEGSSGSCVPKSCVELGNKQCGEWQDGCGGVTICGVCNPRRDALPETWRLQCVEGQCVRTCPPWEEQGLWFKGEDATEKDWSTKLTEVGAPMELFDGTNSNSLEFSTSSLSHLPPTDAVRLCVKACESTVEEHQKFAWDYCVCGTNPTHFLQVSASSEDYTTAHDLHPKTLHHPAMRAKLKNDETQPKCCDPSPEVFVSKADFPNSGTWKWGTVVADFFDTVDLGCGGRSECEKLGYEREAKVVVFHHLTHLCHLGRHPRQLVKATDLLKKPFPRSYLLLNLHIGNSEKKKVEKAVEILQLPADNEKEDKPVEAETHEVVKGENKTEISSVYHTCSCLGKTKSRDLSSPGLRWLHIPKTGTSFVSTLWNYICDTKGTIDLSISSFLRVDGCGNCYDHALQSRYPLEMYCRPRALAALETQHRPTHITEMVGTGGGGMTYNSSTDENKAAVVGFFRSPSSRITSAFNDNMHAVGMPGKDWQQMTKECRGNVRCYADHAGIPGCMFRMLTGHHCATVPRAPTKPAKVLEFRIKEAVEAMSFIGLTEEWNESICQFHKQFGGTPLQAQFANFHPGSKKHGVDDLGENYTDPMDELVYETALQEFRQRKGEETCYEETTLKEATERGLCIPRTCADLGDKQCGEFADGCGGVTICGVCSPRRDGLPETWRLQCVDGQCIPTCTPWETKGLWHPKKGESHDSWISRLEKAGIPLNETNKLGKKGKRSKLEITSANLNRISPTDAVKLCDFACSSVGSTGKEFAVTFCKCGKQPTKFLTIAPTALDYMSAHSLKPRIGKGTYEDIKRSRAMLATLDPDDTQPRCCNPTPELMYPRGRWVISSFWRWGTVYADFFETIDLKCGGHSQCEVKGVERNASVVVFHHLTHLCHLGRNQGDLISPTDMQRNPFPRSYLRLELDDTYKDGPVISSTNKRQNPAGDVQTKKNIQVAAESKGIKVFARRWQFGKAEDRVVTGDESQIDEGVAVFENTLSPVHTCTCLGKDGGPFDGVVKESQAHPSLRWLHVPKTGTSFIATLWRYACDTRGEIDLKISSFAKMIGCPNCYDYALLYRYPFEMYCRRDAFASLETQHMPVDINKMANFSTGAIDQGETVVGFFRRPASRVVSAFNDVMHANGMNGHDWSALLETCKDNVTCFANHPAIPGCMTRLLSGGGRCSSHDTGNVSLALDALKMMGFVGLTEEWNESVCQFHRVFGGIPSQQEFSNVHPGSSKKKVSDLSPNYSDPTDDVIYGEAVREFHRRKGSKSCYKLVQPDGSEQNIEAHSELTGVGEKACVPKGCAQLGNKQCGEWPDGCGGITVCGICSPLRNGLPDTWRLQCVRGECVPTCPPWVEAGIWYEEDHGSHEKWSAALEKAGAPLMRALENKYPSLRHRPTMEMLHAGNKVKQMPPSDAVKLCLEACSSHDNRHVAFAEKFCLCGTYPTTFMGIAPFSAGYRRAHNLVESSPKAFETSPPLRAKLFEGETQPKCCEPSEMPSGENAALWRYGTVFADFFETADLGCGGHVECEVYGKEKKATVVVFDHISRLCHLGVKQGDFIESSNGQRVVNPRSYLRLVNEGDFRDAGAATRFYFGFNEYVKPKAAAEKDDASNSPGLKMTEYSRVWNFADDRGSTLSESDLWFSDGKIQRISTKPESEELHTCPCLDENKEENPRHVFPLHGLRWLHIPKTGTSFISTIWSSVCDVRGKIDLEISSHHKHLVCEPCYDHALLTRYPIEMYCRPRALASVTTQHGPVHVKEMADISKEGDARFDGKYLTVGFFRAPKSRIVSAFDDGMHANGMPNEKWVAMLNQCKDNVTCFANYPGIAGCATRMLSGGYCYQSSRMDATPSTSVAIEAVKKMSFIGIMDEWNESICQFHRVFGGTPSQEMFKNIHAGNKKSHVSHLGDGFYDPADDPVYEVAHQEFLNRKGPESCYKALKSGKATEKVCKPKTCSELGNRQCGEWPDGCGGVTVCGVCSPERNGLPDTWRIQCIRGQCINTCPPWVESGIWYRGESRSHEDWMQDLRMVGAPLDRVQRNPQRNAERVEISSEKLSFIPPADAVILCIEACRSSTQLQQEFASKYCVCGSYPSKFMHLRPTATNYRNVHDLLPSIGGGEAPKIKLDPAGKPSLSAENTQPRCCAPAPQKGNPRGTVIPTAFWRQGTVHADFFETIELGCDARVECENHGMEKNATVAVINHMTNLCHLGRNQGDFIFWSDVMSPVIHKSYFRFERKRRYKEGPLDYLP